MKTFYLAISFLALLGSPVSCAIEEMNHNGQQTSESEYSSATETDIDPPIMPNKPQ